MYQFVRAILSPEVKVLFSTQDFDFLCSAIDQFFGEGDIYFFFNKIKPTACYFISHLESSNSLKTVVISARNLEAEIFHYNDNKFTMKVLFILFIKLK